MANRFNKLFQFLKIGNNPTIEPAQVAENGSVDLAASLDLAARQPRNLMQHLMGRNLEIETDTVNPKTNEITTERFSKFQPGMLNDIASGAKENFAQGYSPYNLQDKIGTEGQNKGLAYRIGEGAGSLGRGLKRGLGAIGRFADTPLGRAAITAGIVGATGGSGLEMLAYGGTTGLSNQQNRLKDQMYRNELQKMGFDTTGINGYIGDDTFNKIFQSKQLQDNAEYRNALLETNKINQQFANQMAKDKLEYQKRQDERDYNLDRERIAQGWANVEANREKANQPKPLSDSQVEKINTAQETIETLKNIEKRYSNEKYKSAFGLKGAIRAEQAKSHPILYAPFDNEITLVRQDVEMLRQKYAKAMEGGRMSDSDRNFYQNVLMSQNLSYENFLEGVRRLRISEENSLQRRLNNYRSQGKNVDGFEDYNSNYSQPQNVSSGNNKLNQQIQKLRDAGYSEAQINEYLKLKGLR